MVLLNLSPIEVEDGRIVFEGEPGEEHDNPIGSIHGGFAMSILDSALGCAIHIGRTTAVFEARLTDASGRLFATATTACAIFRPAA